VIYLDSCLLMYLVEDHALFGSKVAQAMTECADEEFAISPLVSLECLVGPLRAGDKGLAAVYKKAFSQFRSLAMTEQVFEKAARLRAEHGLRTPDALHLACAQAGRCDALWTNDRRFGKAAPGFVEAICR